MKIKYIIYVTLCLLSISSLAFLGIIAYHKNMKLITHILVLVVSFGLVFMWEQTFLSDYTIQALGVLIVTYLVISFIRRKKKLENANFSGASDIFILNTAILLLISITGNLYSPLFFLLYFLGFGITFIFEPITVFIFALGTIAVFLPEAIKNGSIESFIRIGSVLLIAPLAFFFGKEYKDRDEQEEQITEMKEREEDAGKTIAKDVEEVITEEKEALKQKDVEKLNEILEEAESLREESAEK